MDCASGEAQVRVSEGPPHMVRTADNGRRVLPNPERADETRTHVARIRPGALCCVRPLDGSPRSGTRSATPDAGFGVRSRATTKDAGIDRVRRAANAPGLLRARESLSRPAV